MGMEFDKQLRAVKTYDELKKLIQDTIKSIPHYKALGNEELLNSVREFLQLLLALSTYLVGKKKDNLVEGKIVNYQERITGLNEVVKEINEILPLNLDLYKTIKLNLDQDGNLDIPNMNRWIKDIINLYRENGKVLDDRDFTNLFTGVNCLEDNELVLKYMKLFFRLPNDLENSEFIKFYVDNFSDDVADRVIDNNQMALIINRAMRIIYGKYSTIFGKKKSKINKLLRENGFEDVRVDIENLYDLMSLISNEILRLQGLIGKAYMNGSYNEILNSDNYEYYYDERRELQIQNDMLVQRLLKMLGKSKEQFLTDDGLKNDLASIIAMVGKIALFDSVKDEFVEYKEKYEIDQVIKRIEDLEFKHKLALGDMSSFMEDYLSVVAKKTGLMYPKSKKDRNLEVLDDLRKVKVDKLEEIEMAIHECHKKIVNFLEAFYADYQVSEKIINAGFISGFNAQEIDMNNPMAFDTFSIKQEQLSTAEINQMNIFIRNGIRIPDIKTEEFDRLAKLCMTILRDEYIFMLISRGYKFGMDINSEYLDRIDSGEFDRLIPDAVQSKGRR